MAKNKCLLVVTKKYLLNVIDDLDTVSLFNEYELSSSERRQFMDALDYIYSKIYDMPTC